MVPILFKWILLLSLFQLSACRKLEDLILSGQTGGLPKYKIEKITSGSGKTTSSVVFKYDNHDNPTSAIFSPDNGFPIRIFRYDHNHRLTDYISLRSDSVFYDLWHRYKYNAKGLIVQDSVYRDGSFSEDPNPVGHDNQAILYTYDSHDRMTVAATYYRGTIHQDTWQYDQNGNRIRSGITYDNKVNPSQTNKIWMFLNHEYSVNNPIPATSYNQHGLPLGFNHPVEAPDPFNSSYFLGEILNVSTIAYSSK